MKVNIEHPKYKIVKKVYESELMNGSIICTFYLLDDGNYLRVQQTPVHAMEGIYSQEEYDNFLEQVKFFNEAVEKGKKKSKK